MYGYGIRGYFLDTETNPCMCVGGFTRVHSPVRLCMAPMVLS